MGRVRDASVSLVEDYIAPGEFSVCYRCKVDATMMIGPNAPVCPTCRAGRAVPENAREAAYRIVEAAVAMEFRARLAKSRAESGLYEPKFWEKWNRDDLIHSIMFQKAKEVFK